MNKGLVYDKGLAVEQAGGSAELAAELFSMLVKELPSHRINLHSALSARDFTQLQQHAHKLNGAATYTGVPELKHLAEHLDRRLRRGDVAGVEEHVAKVMDEIDRVMEFAQGGLAMVQGF